MSESSRLDGESASVEITGKIMVVAIIVLFMVVVFVLFLHLYAKWFWWRIDQPTPPSQRHQRRRRRFVFAPGQDPTFTLRRGLDPAILRSMPILTFNPQDFKDGMECAVCLSDLLQGEKARLLPKCNHGYHVDCIDMWFQSHSTCPLCRNPVALQGSDSPCVQSAEQLPIQSPTESFVSEYSMDSPNFPTNVLFWGNDTQVSTRGAGLEEAASSQPPSSSSPSSSSGVLMIDIPVNLSENLSSLSPTRFAEEEPKSPIPSRLRSLKRLLSREKRVAPTSSSSTTSSIDV